MFEISSIRNNGRQLYLFTDLFIYLVIYLFIDLFIYLFIHPLSKVDWYLSLQ